ncbi:hypothetical protein CVV68_10845 [Arthrobacter livingstonensis]|uniref:D-alanyl-D-alanine carboxypeptidase-like core domain-containing protein n=1 Tax=Arthrobacter livingstonensis TaxID=670078 RepID=A0A2V5L919_9MICC|nr:hypothetical protein CVV68_10845 [Arthrobacter livingstonensis]
MPVAGFRRARRPRPTPAQVSLYNSHVVQKGVAAADTPSGRPGFSEHQTGSGLDV